MKKEKETNEKAEDGLPDVSALYAQACAACHQPECQGLPGAFPALAGSEIINDDNPETLIRIILQGYDARAEYAAMPPFATQLSDRSEEHTSELQSLMRISYAVFCLKKKNTKDI